MNPSPANSIRRIAGTLLVFLALFVACAGVHAMPGHSADTVSEALYVDAGDGVADLDEEDLVSSLEDNNCGLDDTFDVPPEHAVTMPRLRSVSLPGFAPPPHAHTRTSELRPPIA